MRMYNLFITKVPVTIWMLLLAACLPLAGFTQARTWQFSVSGGMVHNLPTPLTIHQQGEPAIRVNARYKTEPFTAPFYYDFNLTTLKDDRGWSVSLTHHKLTLKDAPSEIQRFSITDGFNFFTINRLWHINAFAFSIGGGMVITHPESTIRNRPFPENNGIFNRGYYISGPAVQAAVIRMFFLTKAWFVSGQGRCSASYVQVPVSGGYASVPNTALHLLIGTGIRW